MDLEQMRSPLTLFGTLCAWKLFPSLSGSPSAMRGSVVSSEFLLPLSFFLPLVADAYMDKREGRERAIYGFWYLFHKFSDSLCKNAI